MLCVNFTKNVEGGWKDSGEYLRAPNWLTSQPAGRDVVGCKHQENAGNFHMIGR